ncbi:hypothetical protein [Planococcus versutus]|nr:hypothetical protein [Planococcus versutus]
MMEFGEPAHIAGAMVFISFISILIGTQLTSIPEKEHEKNR